MFSQDLHLTVFYLVLNRKPPVLCLKTGKLANSLCFLVHLLPLYRFQQETWPFYYSRLIPLQVVLSWPLLNTSVFYWTPYSTLYISLCVSLASIVRQESPLWTCFLYYLRPQLLITMFFERTVTFNQHVPYLHSSSPNLSTLLSNISALTSTKCTLRRGEID